MSKQVTVTSEDDMTVQTEEAPAKVEKPRGDCTGCKFDYQLGTARKGEYKGQLVVRKHNSRTGPGLCDGAQKPPRAETPAVGEAFADPAPVVDVPPYFTAGYDSMGSCGHDIMAGEEIRADGEGGFLCGLCSDEGPKPDRPQHVYDNGKGGVYVHEGLLQSCVQDECAAAREATAELSEALPHDRTPETITHIPNGHDFTDSSGATFRHGGEFADCTTVECVQFRNRISPPPTDTPVQHQCEHGLYADIRNCPGHGVATPSVPVAVAPNPFPHTVPPVPRGPFDDPALVPHVVYSDTPHEVVQDPAAVNGTLVLPTAFADPAPTPVEKLATSARQAFPDHTPGQLADIVQLAQEIRVGTATPVAVAPGGGPVFVDPHEREATSAIAAVKSADIAQFADPVQTPAELPAVSGQPEPDRDQWGRYKILGSSYTRATTFAKLGSSTYALGEWNERMLIAGLAKRPDLLAMAHGLDVKRDKGTLNKIADDAQEFAGNKVAANIGTAYHSFTEQLDAGLITLDQVPEQWRGRCRQYLDALAAHRLTTRREWIERTTAVRADQVSAPIGVAGTLDRIFEMPDGSLVIGDLKTSSNIEYSWSEIAVQLALYAHGVNTHGLFDWNTKTWENRISSDQPTGVLRVRTDFAIVMHLPADGDGCVLYRVDLVKGWEFAQVSGMVQARQKAKDVAGVMVPPPAPVVLPQTVPAPVLAAAEGPAPREDFVRALELVRGTSDPARLMPLHQYAVDSGLFTGPELEEIKAACAARWAELNTPF